MGRFNSDRVDSEKIGENTRIWGVARVLPGAVIGADCNINDFVFIENDVIIGDNVTVKCGVQLWDGTRIEDNVFIGPNVTFTNDRYPVSGNSGNYKREGIVIRKGASIGGGAVLLPGIEIGTGAMVGAGSVVTRNVPEGTVVMGNPARVTGATKVNEPT